ncbi:MAG: hypothetical protein GX416_01845 [Bacteroidales bacterium]|nr:hypothetical protein [Bacteroidales bacterium]
MKEMKYVNMFNQGVKRVQDMLRDNGNKEAQFDVSKLTVFCVNVFSNEEDINDTQGDTQDDTQISNIPQGTTLDAWIENQIKLNPKITTEEMAKMSKKSIITIKRHILKLDHIQYIGSGYSGHWKVKKKE